MKFSLLLVIKINLKWIEDLSVRLETIKRLEKNQRGMLVDTVVGKELLDKMSKAQKTKTK